MLKGFADKYVDHSTESSQRSAHTRGASPSADIVGIRARSIPAEAEDVRDDTQIQLGRVVGCQADAAPARCRRSFQSAGGQYVSHVLR